MGIAYRAMPFLRNLPLILCTIALSVGAARADVLVYDDAMAAGWQDWSWGGVTRNFSSATPVFAGSSAVATTFTGGWSGLQLGNAGGVDVTAYDALRFQIHGGSAGGQSIEVRCGNDSTYVSQLVVPVAGMWTQVDLPLAELGTPRHATYVYWFNNTAGSQPTFHLDQISFLQSGLPTPTPIPPGAGPALSIDAALDHRPIDPAIYGMNFTDEGLAAELRLPVRRWGGNAVTRYNWQNDTSNRASDWFFENIPNDNAQPQLLPSGSSSDQFIDQDRRTGTQTVLTVPLIGWTPKTRDYACGFSVAKYGTQQSTDPWRPDCGNGVRTNGTHVTGNDPLDTSIAIDPSFVQSWMLHLIGRYGNAEAGGVRYYALDNEPMLWPDTHRDVHPQPTSYDEVRDRSIAYAAAIKSIDAGAKTLGPVVWGWSAYFWSALDWAPGGAWWNNPQDRLAHGNVPFLRWYLQQMRAYEMQHGVRILDYLDIHYYPQGSGVALAPAGGSATQALRLRSTRSLWDPTYTDESWIGEAVRLIPRMREWIDADYPGTKLALTEYNWGALDHLNGALAQADVLGILGREGVDLATLWDPPSSNEPAAFAFRMYRNYDGNHGSFGDTRIRAESADPGQLSVYAARRSSDGALTAMVINKSQGPLTSTLTMAGVPPSALAELYRYSGANLTAIARDDDLLLMSGSVEVTFPAASISLLVIPADDPVATPTPTRTPTPSATIPSPTNTPTMTNTPTTTFTATPVVAACGGMPRTDCGAAARGAFKIKRGAKPAADALVWKWSKGTVEPAAFGDPTATTSYTLCLYQDGAFVTDLVVLAAGHCGARPCWKALSNGRFQYKNRTANADAITGVKLSAGSGSASIVVQAKGVNLNPPLPLLSGSTVTTQWNVGDAGSGECWESVFAAPARRSDAQGFDDRLP